MSAPDARLQDIMEEVDLDQFVSQPVPDDPEKLRLSLIFSKDLITTLQQDIADLHHRLHIADTDYDAETHPDDEDDDERAGIHEKNPTITSKWITGQASSSGSDNDEEPDPSDNLGVDELERARAACATPITPDLYGMEDDPNDDDAYAFDDEKAADTALSKKGTEHEKFFSTYNILSKRLNGVQSLIESMGSYQALLLLSDNAVTFSEIVANLQLKLKTAKDSFSTVSDALDGLGVDVNIDDDGDEDGDEEDLERKLFVSSAKQVLRECRKIVATVDETIDELNGAKPLVHPDQKRIAALQTQLKELQVSLPVHKLKKLAILSELPTFIKQELSDAKIAKQAQAAREIQRQREARKGHKKKRTKTLVDDDIPDVDLDAGDFKFRPEDENPNHNDTDADGYDSEEAEQHRIESFDSTMDGVSQSVSQLKTQLDGMGENLDTIMDDLEMATDETGSLGLVISSVKEMKSEMSVCNAAAKQIVHYLSQAKEYVHPTQNVLISAINQLVEQKIENDKLTKQMAFLNAELQAKHEQIETLKLGLSENGTSEPTMASHGLETETQTQTFVKRIADQLQTLSDTAHSAHIALKQNSDESEDLSGLKNKTSLDSDSIRRMDSELATLRATLEELSTALMRDELCVLNLTPTHEYLGSLEARYANLKSLYALKFKELEQAKDAVIYNEFLVETKGEEIEELEGRLLRIMTSASTAAETRLDAISTMNASSQTYQSVLNLIDDNLRNSSSALNEVEQLTRVGLSQSSAREVANYCKTIRQGIEAVHAEMSGARNFVHPDRDMVHFLQQELLELKRQQSVGLRRLSNASTDQKDNDREVEESESEEEDEESSSPQRKGVHFTSATMAATMASSSQTQNQESGSYRGSSERRTKSVHEIAWSKFNAGKETQLEELQNREREALEDQMRAKIMDEIQQEYDDKFDTEMAAMSAQIKKSVREEVRSEYEDLLERARGQRDDQDLQGSVSPLPPAIGDIGQNVSDVEAKLEEVYDERLEAETAKVREYYEKEEGVLKGEMEELRRQKERLQSECAAMQSEMEVMRRVAKEREEGVEEVMASKFRLIESTSREIDALRRKIFKYTKGEMFK